MRSLASGTAVCGVRVYGRWPALRITPPCVKHVAEAFGIGEARRTARGRVDAGTDVLASSAVAQVNTSYFRVVELRERGAGHFTGPCE